MKKLTTEEFIEKAKNVHGNKYDYSKVEYVDAKTKVCIMCPEHGEFYQTPDGHIHGECRKCAHEKNTKKQRLTQEEFIEKAKIVHRNKYDYSKVEYVNARTKVCIRCPEHGEFYQEAFLHLIGCRCQKCGYSEMKNKQSSSTEDFIRKSKLIHNNKYDYSKVSYANNHTKVCIICPIHGEFYQKPNGHLNGNGCQLCNESHLEKEISHLLDDNNIIYERQKRFKWLGLQSLDFYLPLHKIGIECQGEQHFEVNEHFGGEDGFLKTIERDERKYNLCKEHNIKILYYTNVTVPEDYKKYVYTDKEELIKKVCLTKINN